jgi:hypothetical protein
MSKWKMARDCVLGIGAIILLISIMGWLARL